MGRKVKAGNHGKHSSVTLKTVAEHAGVTPGTVSAVLNDSAASRSVSSGTKTRILAAARELDYRPNFLARSLRVKRTHTIGVITEEIGDSYGAMVISGIEGYLRQRGYFFLTVAHRHDPVLLDSYSHLLLQRGVEGFITLDTSIREIPALPTVAIAGHRRVREVTNLILDHRIAARMALEHLTGLGHEEIAFIRGPASSSDSIDRWNTIVEVAKEIGIRVRPELTVRPERRPATADMGHNSTKKLLARKHPFTALFCYNDNFAIGAIRAIQESGLRVPDDISVVGFDDISAAAYGNPSITTVRQPLRKMGELAAKIVVGRIENDEAYVPQIAVKPEFVVRQSTAHVRVLQPHKVLIPTPIRVND
jgi:DNA-binding LacI/PurR family transcriptional regulator